VTQDHLLDRVVAAVGDQYLIEAEIGRGGMAVVYRALDLRLQRRVAIKVLPPELSFNGDVRERFLREAQTAAQLSHPHIVPIFSVDERGGIVYFVMALVEGETVGQLMKRGPRRPVDEVRRILSGVADALAYAHRHGVIHRDVKPDNILVDRASGRPMVTDFGIARAAAADSRLTVTGIAVGTPTYMSPEQAMGEREIDGRSDIYSLGVVGFQMLSGEPPFTAANAPALLMKHVAEAPRALGSFRPDVPPPLSGAIMRALAKKPPERWKDADTFRDAIMGVGPAAAVATAYAAKTGQMHAAVRPHRPVSPPGAPAPPIAAPWPSAPAPEPIESLGILVPPAGLSRKERIRWYKEQDKRNKDFDRRSVGERIVVFRRKVAGNLATIVTLGTVNALVSPDFWWFLFPTAFITVDMLSKGGSLWADGVSWKQIFGRRSPGLQEGGSAMAAVGSGSRIDERALRVAGPDVLAGEQGPTVRRAAEDRRVIDEVLSMMGKTERSMIPDVGPTAQGLLDRVGSLATMLHRIGAEGHGSLATVDARLEELRREPDSVERERRLTLLERQRTSLAELTGRRRTLVNQLESAVLALENLKLELLKLRSAGLSAGLDEATSATQAARALTRDIEHAVEAAEDVRKL
jgi:tRNA A-37 threonylcarbamoyl transferase component Bud32